ncbi:MAG TPA: SDR family NAD(P)-dependent oxidoreductase [Solirubrobacterales bacterium]
MFELTDRVAVVTGAASGIGAATARLFARAGADVVLGYYPGDPYDVEAVRADVEAAGRRGLAVPVDVRRPEQVDALVGRAMAELGRLDIAVANAGIARAVPFEDLDDDAWYATLDVDLTGVWRLFRAAIPPMTEAGYGRLIATSSVAGTTSAWPGNPQYAAAKAGIVGLVQNVAVDHGPDGITANAVAPGVIETPQALDPVNSLGPDGVAAVAAKVPLRRRVGVPEDIANLYCFLAAPESEYVTGQLIVADGARSLAGLD